MNENAVEYGIIPFFSNAFHVIEFQMVTEKNFEIYHQSISCWPYGHRSSAYTIQLQDILP